MNSLPSCPPRCPLCCCPPQLVEVATLIAASEARVVQLQKELANLEAEAPIGEMTVRQPIVLFFARHRCRTQRLHVVSDVMEGWCVLATFVWQCRWFPRQRMFPEYSPSADLICHLVPADLPIPGRQARTQGTVPEGDCRRQLRLNLPPPPCPART